MWFRVAWHGRFLSLGASHVLTKSHWFLCRNNPMGLNLFSLFSVAMENPWLSNEPLSVQPLFNTISKIAFHVFPGSAKRRRWFYYMFKKGKRSAFYMWGAELRGKFPGGEANTGTRSTASMPSHFSVLMEPGDAYASIAFAFRLKKLSSVIALAACCWSTLVVNKVSREDDWATTVNVAAFRCIIICLILN